MSDIVTVRFARVTPQLLCETGRANLQLGSEPQSITMTPPVVKLTSSQVSQSAEVKAVRAVLSIQAKSAQISQAILVAVPAAAADRLPCSENLAPGDFVNIWDNAGVASLRLADNRDPDKAADGFVLQAYTAGDVATYFRGGDNARVSGAAPGQRCWLGAAGWYIQTPLDNSDPSNSGKISQLLGKALSATLIQFHRMHAVRIA